MQWNEFSFHIRHLSTQEQKTIEKAFELGLRVHEGQKRMSGEPYFTHPIAVAGILAGMNADADTIIAALLHDSVEDTPLSLGEIEQIFNTTVAELIDGVTKLTREDLEDKPTLDEQIETIRKIFHLMQDDVRIMIIKLVDRLHNMQTIEFLNEEKRKNMAKETVDIYVKIAERLSMADVRDALEGLCLSVLEPEIFAELTNVRKENEKTGKKILKTMQETLEQSHPDAMQEITILYERKQWERLRQQMLAEGAMVTGLSALTLVFVCPSIDRCYRLMGALHQIWQRETLSFEDYINLPLLNGYRGVHTTIILTNGMRIRCKIRTPDMEEYAHKGITTSAFSNTGKRLVEQMPWAQRISTLDSDTQNRSQEFWESLQGDILGEFMLVHGPSDLTASVPRGGTVLDGAFYLFQDKALRVRSIRLNGQVVEPSRLLKHGDSITVEFVDKKKSVDREWLHYVQTGLATAIIRKALGDEPREIKRRKGKELLQEEMTKRKAGFIEEFDQEKLKEGLLSIGQESLDEAYERIADGHLEPSQVMNAIISRRNAMRQEEAKMCVIQFRINLEDIDSIARTIEIYKKYDIQMKNIQLRPFSLLSGFVRVRVALTPEAQRNIAIDLKAAGMAEISIRSVGAMARTIVLVSVLLLLWGLDPVFAHYLLRGSISFLDLTFIRAVTFFVASGLIYVGHMALSPQKLKRLSPLHPSLLLSGLALFFTALFSYLTLTNGSATEYILFIIEGLVVGSLVEKVLQGKNWINDCISAALIGCGIIFVIIQQHSSAWTIGAGIGSGVGFVLYSRISKQYQMKEAGIQARYPAFLFWLSVSAVILSLLLLPYTHLSAIPTQELVRSILFVLIFTVLPYTLYFESIRRIPTRILDQSLPFVAVVTLSSEFLLFGITSHFILVPLLALFLWHEYRIHKN